MIKISQFAFGFSLLLSVSNLGAEDLIDVYQLALKNDPSWAARESSYQADKEQENQAKSLLRPNVGIVYSKSRTSRTAPDIGAGIAPEFIDSIEQSCDIGIEFPICRREVIDYLSDPTNETFILTESGSTKQRTTSDNFSLKFSQPLFNLQNWYINRGARSLASRIDAEFAFAEQDFIVNVAEAYFNVLKAGEELHFAQTEQSAIGKQLNQTKEGLNIGLTKMTDVHEAQGAYDLSQTGVIIAETLLENSQEQLTTLTNRSEFRLAKLAENFPISVPQPAGSEAWVKMSNDYNKNLLATRYVVNAAKHKVTEKSAGYAPQIDFFASIDNLKTDTGDNNPVGTSGSLGSDLDSQTIGININIPLYSGGLTSSQIREAKHRHYASRAQLEAQSRKTAALTRSLYRKVTDGVKKIDSIRITIASNQYALEATQAGYATGTRNVFDVLQAQRSLFSIKRDYSNARYDYLIDSLKLKQVAGILEAIDLRLLNEWLEPI